MHPPAERARVQVTGTIAFDTLATVPALPGKDETARVQHLRRMPGGAAGNVAAGLARLGERPRLIAAVGPDFAGSAYEAELSKSGVDLRHLVREADTPTAHAISVSDPEGAQHVYFYPGAAYALDEAPPFPEADLGHFSAGPIHAYRSRMQACRIVTFDPGQEVFHRDLDEVTAVVPLVDVLFLNAHELARLEADADLGVDALLGAGPRVVIVTHGKDGQVVHTRDAAPTRVAAVPPTRIVEPTGAGDAHRTGFLFALARGADPVDACRVGSVVASFAIAAMGTQEGLPALPDVRARYESAFGAWPLTDAA